MLSIQNLYSRNTGARPSANQLRHLRVEQIEADFDLPEVALAASSNLRVLRCLETEVTQLEDAVKAQVKLKPAFQQLLTVDGIGLILGMTIMLEAGDINRFAKVGNFASYCRCVDSQKLSNGKRKGRGNTKNGNKYLAWAFVEAANFAIRYNPQVKRFYQRKCAKTQRIVALKAVAHKLARACYYILRDEVAFDSDKAFG
ncbi:MAG: IS110 family transposase [Planctomycetaceae bacterium]|nr:IS110 family transposase [Planctomycetaceae bacterium]